MNTCNNTLALQFSNMLQREDIWQWGIQYGAPHDDDKVIVSFVKKIVVVFTKTGDIYATRTTEMGRKVWPSRQNLDEILVDVKEALKDEDVADA